MPHILFASTLAIAITSPTDAPTLTISLRATVTHPLDVTVLNDSEQAALTDPPLPVRITRDLNTGTVHTTPKTAASAPLRVL